MSDPVMRIEPIDPELGEALDQPTLVFDLNELRMLLLPVFKTIGSMTDLTPENAHKVFEVMSWLRPYLGPIEDQGE